MQENIQPQYQEEPEIDIMELLSKLWKNRKMILWWCAVGAVIGIVAGFSIPKTYRASVMLAPETQTRIGSGVSAIASMMGTSLDNSVDAIDCDMYPDVVASTPFLYQILDLQVTTQDGQIDTTLKSYILDHQKSPWWGKVIGAPFKVVDWAVGLVKPEEEEAVSEGTEVNISNLPKEDRDAIKYLATKINVSVDKKSGKTQMSLEMQDPLVVAAVLEAVVNNLKTYMSDYRTSKARQDVTNLSAICEDRRQDYYIAQRAYADYMDSNKSITRQSALVEKQRLQQEMNLAYQVYTQVATQLEGARIKVQQSKPVFAVINPVTVPLKKAGPSKVKMLVAFAFLFGCCAAAWVVFGKDYWQKLKENL